MSPLKFNPCTAVALPTPLAACHRGYFTVQQMTDVQKAESLLQSFENGLCGVNRMLYERTSVKQWSSYIANMYHAFYGLKVLKIIMLLVKVVYSAKE